LQVTEVCVGGSPLGSVPEIFGYDVPAERGVATARRALEGPLNFLDTAAIYSNGESERRIGIALGEVGGLPPGFVLATKADRDPETGDFSGAQVRRSVQGSLERLGLDHSQLMYLHDPEAITFEEATAPGGAVDALVEMQQDGTIGALGVAGGPVELMSRYLRTGVFDVLITHNRWTLVDRSADALIDEAGELGVAVVNAAPFGGGILVRGPGATRSYGYRPASEEVLRRVAAMEQACARAGVSLATAALQFSTRDPRIASTIVGVSRPERIDETVALATTTVPESLWDELAVLPAPEDEWLW
jgi:D-threo-aldose 1-dehydrogenase